MQHKVIFGFVAIFILSLMVVFPISDILPQNHNSGTPDTLADENIAEAFGKLPILFIENQGQLDEAVEYYIKAPAQTLYFTREGIIFDLTRYNQAEATGTPGRQVERLVFSLDFLGANGEPTIEGVGKNVATVSYLKGNDPEQWHTGISTYREVVYHDIYPAVDLRLRDKGDALEYDFVVKPGATPETVTLAYNGIDSLSIESGELIVSTAFGNFRQDMPYIYQHIGDETVEVAGGFRLDSDNAYGFYVADYDSRYQLVIDPTLAYSTYLGGSIGGVEMEPGGPGGDWGWGIAVDEAGCAYVIGGTNSTDFPTENAYQDTNAGEYDVFVAKLSAAGDSLIYSTYLGGSSWDNGIGIVVDEAGRAYITGDTLSSDFPTRDPYQAAKAGEWDGFVTKLSAAGDSLIYSTYLGGSTLDSGFAIAVDTAGCAYITGRTNSSNFPTENPYQAAYVGGVGGYNDAFVTKLSAAGDSLIYSTYLGGNGSEHGYGIAVDWAGCAYVAGWTDAADFPTEHPYQAARAGNSDAFVTKLSAAGDSLIYSTYLGGGAPNFGGDLANGIAVDAAGCAYITGITDSSSFPTQDPYQAAIGGDNDAFVTKLSSAGDSLVYSTYLGGSHHDEGRGIAVDTVGCAYVIGDTSSSDFPTENPYQATYGGGYDDAFVTKLSAAGDTLVYSTYFGGSDTDNGLGIAVDASGGDYVTGRTYSTDFPTENPYQEAFAGGDGDAFVAKFVDTSSAMIDTATGTGVATLTTSNGSITGLTAMATTACGYSPHYGLTFPHGFFSFNITDIPAGSTVTITIAFPSDLAADVQYWKCTPIGWIEIPIVSLSGNVMTIELTDGGLGDTDGAANGTIVDPGGPAVPGHMPLWMIILIILVALLILMAIVIRAMRSG